MHAASSIPSNRVRVATWATMALFFVNGATFATWGIHIPTIRERFDLSDAALSMAMFAVAGGAILVVGRLGRQVARLGSARVSVISGVLFAVATGAILLMPSFVALLPLLIVFGVTNAGFDVAMNAQAATVEAARPHPIMSMLHGMFSLGGMVGAAAGGWMLTLGVAPELHVAAMALVTAVTAIATRGWLLPDALPADDMRSAGGQHRPLLLVLGALAFLGLLGEGAMYDWSTIYMHDIAGTAGAYASAGYAVFSGGMAMARFGGDWARKHVGAPRLLTVSAWLAFLGMVLAVAFPTPWSALLGFMLMGIGAANMVPIFFVTAARLPGVAPAEAIANVARFAYVGMLLGPVIIGIVSHASNLRVGLGVIALSMGIIAVCGARNIRPSDSQQ
jgi:fucose permease